MWRTGDSQRTQRPDLSPVHAEPAEDSLLTAREERPDPTQPARHLERPKVQSRVGPAPPREYVIDLVLRHGPTPFSFGEGAEALARLLERADDVTALFVVSDLSAFGALMECQRRPIPVPGQLSIMGFGNFEIGRVCVPSLTTIAVDAEAIGRETGRLILAMVGAGRSPSPDLPPRTVDLGFELVERESTGKPLGGLRRTKAG